MRNRGVTPANPEGRPRFQAHTGASTSHPSPRVTDVLDALVGLRCSPMRPYAMVARGATADLPAACGETARSRWPTRAAMVWPDGAGGFTGAAKSACPWRNSGRNGSFGPEPAKVDIVDKVDKAIRMAVTAVLQQDFRPSVTAGRQPSGLAAQPRPIASGGSALTAALAFKGMLLACLH